MFHRIAGRMRHTEWKIASLAGLCAVAASVFATHMIERSDEAPGLTGSEHFMIFARPSSTRRDPLMKFAPAPAETAARTLDVDPMPIGAINPRPQGSPAPRPSAAPAKKELAGFFVRGAFDGKVLVQGPTGFELVGPGDKLSEAGPVVSISYRNGRWIVQTESGAISSEPSD